MKTITKGFFLVGSPLPQPNEADFPSLLYKHADLEVVRRDTTSYVKGILASLEENPFFVEKKATFEYTSVDVKVHHLLPGDYPCRPGWHRDIAHIKKENPDEYYFLFVSGFSSLTEFEGDLGSVVGIPSCHWICYQSKHLHRCASATTEEKRLLIRVALQNSQKPSHSPFRIKTWNTR